MNEEFKKALIPEGKTILVGIGNDLRGDDGVGPYIANRLISKNNENFKVINAGPVIENFVEEIINFAPSKLIIIDAAFFNGKGGQAMVLEEEKLSDHNIITTHSIPLTAILKIIREDLKSVKISIIGIQPEKIDFSEELTSNVKKTADEIVNFYNDHLSYVSSPLTGEG
ncbi:MAG: hydrogenase 3 maturation endopeptidase HyCI [Elusimicrobiota bacterium]